MARPRRGAPSRDRREIQAIAPPAILARPLLMSLPMAMKRWVKACGIVAALFGAGIWIGGCAVASPDDPAASLGDEEWADDGPPAGDSGEDISTESAAITNMPLIQLPFPCGQVWAGQTRSNHSPVNSVDFNRDGDLGDTVVAAAGGKVTRVDNEGSVSYGRWVEIDHGNGYRTRYAHLSTQAVSVGQSVSRGQKVGTVGSTGGSTGPHLHFEVRHDGVAVRPSFNGAPALFFGTKNYTSHNCAASSSGGSSGGSGVTGTVNTSGIALTVRKDASTASAAVGSVPDGAKVKITCQKHGTTVTGTYGTSSLWDFIGDGYVADAYVATGSDGQVAPTCK